MMANTLHDIRCARDDLGKPMPDSPHAASVCLPLWEHNVGYEEAEAQVIERLQCGYPRFFVHPQVDRLFAACEARFAGRGERCVAFPSRRVAERCIEFLGRRSGCTATVHEFGSRSIFAVTMPETARKTALDFWQHSGEIISSRRAEAVLEDTGPNSAADAAKPALRERIAKLVQAHADDVYLYPSGMAAIYGAFRVFQKLRPSCASVQFGFPYVDTLKIQQKLAQRPKSLAQGDAAALPAAGAWATKPGSRAEPPETGPAAVDGVYLFPNASRAELEHLERILEQDEVLGLFCEFPCNPLLTTPDLRQLSRLSAIHEFPVVVDDTLATSVNCNLLPAAAALTTSLTKFFSGRGDVMAGSLVLNRQGPFYSQLRRCLQADYEDLLYSADAVVLEETSRDFVSRVRRINRTSEELCDFLEAHPAVERVNYPKYRTPENYRAFLKPGGGFGGLFSIELRDANVKAPAFFDALRLCKGPNLGTNFTLCCPYTILAHYGELDFAESCGVSRYLVRVSVGLEEPDWLIGRFGDALDRLQPAASPIAKTRPT